MKSVQGMMVMILITTKMTLLIIKIIILITTMMIAMVNDINKHKIDNNNKDNDYNNDYDIDYDNLTNQCQQGSEMFVGKMMKI